MCLCFACFVWGFQHQGSSSQDQNVFKFLCEVLKKPRIGFPKTYVIFAFIFPCEYVFLCASSVKHTPPIQQQCMETEVYFLSLVQPRGLWSHYTARWLQNFSKLQREWGVYGVKITRWLNIATHFGELGNQLKSSSILHIAVWYEITLLMIGKTLSQNML